MNRIVLSTAETRITVVMGCMPRYLGGQPFGIFGVLDDAAELEETYKHEQQLL